MRKSVNIEGMKFNRLTAVSFSHKHRYPCGQIKEYWIFKCDCGKEIEPYGNNSAIQVA